MSTTVEKVEKVSWFRRWSAFTLPEGIGNPINYILAISSAWIWLMVICLSFFAKGWLGVCLIGFTALIGLIVWAMFKVKIYGLPLIKIENVPTTSALILRWKFPGDRMNRPGYEVRKDENLFVQLNAGLAVYFPWLYLREGIVDLKAQVIDIPEMRINIQDGNIFTFDCQVTARILNALLFWMNIGDMGKIPRYVMEYLQTALENATSVGEVEEPKEEQSSETSADPAAPKRAAKEVKQVNLYPSSWRQPDKKDIRRKLAACEEAITATEKEIGATISGPKLVELRDKLARLNRAKEMLAGGNDIEAEEALALGIGTEFQKVDGWRCDTEGMLKIDNAARGRMGEVITNWMNHWFNAGGSEQNFGLEVTVKITQIRPPESIRIANEAAAAAEKEKQEQITQASGYAVNVKRLLEAAIAGLPPEVKVLLQRAVDPAVSETERVEAMKVIGRTLPNPTILTSIIAAAPQIKDLTETLAGFLKGNRG